MEPGSDWSVFSPPPPLCLLHSSAVSAGDGKHLQLPNQTCGHILLIASVHQYHTAARQRRREFTPITADSRWLPLLMHLNVVIALPLLWCERRALLCLDGAHVSEQEERCSRSAVCAETKLSPESAPSHVTQRRYVWIIFYVCIVYMC